MNRVKREGRMGGKRGEFAGQERRDAGTQRRGRDDRRRQRCDEENRARRRTEDATRRGNKKRKDRAAPDSAALIFNDILDRAGVPLMHGHYNMLLSLSLPCPPSLSVRYKERVHACTPCAILPRLLFPSSDVLLSLLVFYASRQPNEPSKVARVSWKYEMHYILIYDPHSRDRYRQCARMAND